VSLTLAQLIPVASTAFVAAAMVRFGLSQHRLEIRRARRCAACGLEQRSCRCSS
jgi:hypothetical protein